MSITIADLLVMSGSKTPLAAGHRLQQLLLDVYVVQQTQAKRECNTQLHSRLHDINLGFERVPAACRSCMVTHRTLFT